MSQKTSLKILIVALILVFNTISAQDYGADSLNNYGYLGKQFYKHGLDWDLKNYDKEKATNYANLYIQKAKKEGRDPKRMISAHNQMTFISGFENSLAHLDTVIQISKKQKNNSDYLGTAYFDKANIYYDNGDYKNALENYIVSLDFARQNKKHYRALVLNQNIGLIKLERIGREREALEIFKENEKYFDTIPDKQEYGSDYIAILSGLSGAYSKLKVLDSSSHYNKKGLLEADKIKWYDYNYFFHYTEGVNEYLRGNLKNAQELLESIEPEVKSIEEYSGLMNVNYYLGKVHQGLGNQNKAVKHFLTLDSINDHLQEYNLQTRRGMEELINHYSQEKDIDKELTYVKKLLKLDSIYIDEYTAIVRTMNAKYDNTNLLMQKEELNNKLNRSKRFSNLKSYLLISLLILLIAIWTHFLVKQKRLKKRFDVIMNDMKHIPEVTHFKRKQLSISEDIINTILKNLEVFEGKASFIQKGLNAQIIAKKINTNTKYLSMVVNAKKGKSLVNYINDLRIDYAIEKLKNDTRFKHYTIESIAEEVGFSNTKSFTQSFYKRTNLKPSFFIKQLKKT